MIAWIGLKGTYNDPNIFSPSSNSNFMGADLVIVSAYPATKPQPQLVRYVAVIRKFEENFKKVVRKLKESWKKIERNLKESCKKDLKIE